MKLIAIEQHEISRYLPHAGNMCLLQSVAFCDAQEIVCETLSHQLAENPLRANNQLHAVNGIEYAAQAAALHLALQNFPGKPVVRQGFLASVQEVDLFVDRLDDINSSLAVKSQQLFFDQAAGAMYTFVLLSGEKTLLSGRLLIMLSK